METYGASIDTWELEVTSETSDILPRNSYGYVIQA